MMMLVGIWGGPILCEEGKVREGSARHDGHRLIEEAHDVRRAGSEEC